MKRNIAIVAGGDSSEIVISLKSAEGIFSFLDKDKYNVYIAIVKRDEWAVKLPGGEHTPIDKNDFSFRENGEIRHFDFAYITIHGTPGEDGRLQGYFDMIGMPYSSCGMFVSALTFNKFACNHYLKGFGVDIAHSIHLFKGQTVTDEEVVSRLGLPVFVKPNDGGSSFGVTKVKEASAIQPAIDKAFSEGREVVIESLSGGRHPAICPYPNPQITGYVPGVPGTASPRGRAPSSRRRGPSASSAPDIPATSRHGLISSSELIPNSSCNPSRLFLEQTHGI